MIVHIQVGLKSRVRIPLPNDLLTIGELARITGRRTSSIRYYEEIGLLPEPMRRSGQRRYDQGMVRKLSVIDTAQRAGLALDEIRALLGGAPGHDAVAVEHLRHVAGRKLPQVTALIERAILMRRWLEAAARCECPELDECWLFDNAALPSAAPGRAPEVDRAIKAAVPGSHDRHEA
jgi:DNA-binding transcriptional MerR regulator